MAPIRIDSISLSNMRALDELHIHPEAPENGHGQWIVLIGPNGSGKTTLLRALALALVDLKSQPNRLPATAFSSPWRKQKNAPAKIEIKVNSKTYICSIGADPFRNAGQERLDQSLPNLPPSEAPTFPVYGYGCRRGSALGGSTREVNDEPGSEIYTLFDEGADLVHAETWLLLRENEALKDPGGPKEKLYHHILNVLIALMPGVELIESQEAQVYVHLKGADKILLQALSDGYLTMMGWALDLIARWIKRREQKTIGERFNEEMSGLVLIDEVDLHLHPAWQGRVLRDIQKAFPRMSFVVTTHNPLTLLGARAKDIWKLSRGEDGRIRAEQGSDKPILMTGSEIYQSYFDLQSLFPDEVGQLFYRFQTLASNPVRDDEEEAELAQVRMALHKNGIDPGWEPVAREPIPPYPGEGASKAGGGM